METSKDVRRKLAKKYNAMKQRCNNPNNKDYKNYGARGISICAEWLNDFNRFYLWAVESGYKIGMTIDRIDCNKGYFPDNCRWATMKEQQSNKRTNVYVNVNGDIVTMAEASRKTGLSESAIWDRVNRGVTVDAPKYIREKPVKRSDGAVFKSVKDAALITRTSESHISQVCKGKRARAGGYSFSYMTREDAEKALEEMNNDERRSD